jgi:hypothetical protein
MKSETAETVSSNPSFLIVESDDDTPDDTHTQRVLANYYLSTEGVLPPWLTPPPSLMKTISAQRPSYSTQSSTSGNSYRTGKSVSLQDIYDSAGLGRQDGHGDQRPLSNDRLRNKLRPSSTSNRPSSGGEDYYSGSRGNYSGRSGFGGGEDYDPYASGYNQSNEQGRPNNPRQGQYGTGSNSGQYGRPPPRR